LTSGEKWFILWYDYFIPTGKIIMGNSIKFSISVPAREFKELESIRRKARKSRSQFVREAVRAWESTEVERPAGIPKAAIAIKEDSARYGAPAPALPELTDLAELRRRAIAAAGRFRSGVADLSTAHDIYFEEAFSTGAEPGPPSEPKSGEKP
jgi:Arc/MetJ-type ribon-helix-helix transcriptional regulator